MSYVWMLHYMNSKGQHKSQDHDKITRHDNIELGFFMMALETIQKDAQNPNKPHHIISKALIEPIREIDFEEKHPKYRNT